MKTDAAPVSISATGRRPRARPTSDRRGAGPRCASPPSCFALTVLLRPPGVLRRRLQLRRDVPRDPGPGHRRRRRPLPGGGRPQAAARAVHLRGDVRGHRHHRAVVGAGAGDARGRAHRVAARARGATTLRHRRRVWIAGVLMVLALGGVRAPGRSGGELRDLHAAERWSRRCSSRVAARVRRPAPPSRSPRSPSRPAPRRCSRSCTSLWKRRGRAGSPRLGRVHSSRRARRAAGRPGRVVVLDRARQRLVRRAQTASGPWSAMFVLMTLGVGVRATCRSCGRCPRAWRERQLADDGDDDTDLWLWLAVGRGVGRGRPAVLRPLLPAARPAARASHRRASLSVAARAR